MILVIKTGIFHMPSENRHKFCRLTIQRETLLVQFWWSFLTPIVLYLGVILDPPPLNRTSFMNVPLPFRTGEIQRIACELNWFLLLL